MDQRENNEIDAVLEQQLLGATFDADLSFHAIGLQPSHQFNWNRIMDDPKGDHGVYEGRGNWYKTMKYEVLHSGGFLRLYTLRGRVYWNGQNETEHTTPDWKLHFSCELDHIGVAWNALAALFMDMKCEIGMKSTTLNAEQWSSGQRGREITVYIYRYHYTYNGYMQGVVPEHDHDMYLGPELHEVYTAPFWYSFIVQAETRLTALGVRSRGVASGDLALPGCRYASLRNEAYVAVSEQLTSHETTHTKPIIEVKTDEIIYNSDQDTEMKGNEDNSSSCGTGETIDPETARIPSTPCFHSEAPTRLGYPPNHTGWNAACHPNPFLDVIFFLRERQRSRAIVGADC